MTLYKITCGLWDDIDGTPVFWAGTKRDAQRVKRYIIQQSKAGGDWDGAVQSEPEIQKHEIPTDKRGLLNFLQSAAQIEHYPTYPSDLELQP